MAVTQQVYFDAIGRAGLVFSDGVLENIGLEKAGCKPYWERLFEQFKQIECAEFFLEIEDYETELQKCSYHAFRSNTFSRTKDFFSTLIGKQKINISRYSQMIISNSTKFITTDKFMFSADTQTWETGDYIITLDDIDNDIDTLF